MLEHRELVSFGCGVNSVAMTIMLVNGGWRGAIVFADTGCEWPETYCYLSYFTAWLERRGLEIITLGSAYRALGPGRDTRTLVEFCADYACTPFPGSRWCTQGWKTDPINHWAKEHGVETQLLGIAADEEHRQRGRVRPLVDRGITRAECIDIILAEGLEVPQKSGCYICPFQSWAQFRELYRRHPDLYERAANLERLSSARRGVTTYLHVGGERTLDEFAMTLRGQQSWLDDTELDELLVYRPCICGT